MIIVRMVLLLFVTLTLCVGASSIEVNRHIRAMSGTYSVRADMEYWSLGGMTELTISIAIQSQNVFILLKDIESSSNDIFCVLLEDVFFTDSDSSGYFFRLIKVGSKRVTEYGQIKDLGTKGIFNTSYGFDEFILRYAKRTGKEIGIGLALGNQSLILTELFNKLTDVSPSFDQLERECKEVKIAESSP